MVDNSCFSFLQSISKVGNIIQTSMQSFDEFNDLQGFVIGRGEFYSRKSFYKFSFIRCFGRRSVIGNILSLLHFFFFLFVLN